LKEWLKASSGVFLLEARLLTQDNLYGLPFLLDQSREKVERLDQG
jgi:hypothetical protein